MRAHRKTATKFYMVVKLDVKKIFKDRSRPLPWEEFLVTRDVFVCSTVFHY